MSLAIEVEGLHKTFILKKGKGLKRYSAEMVAVDNLSLTVEKGQAVAFIGPNGAGKSTTIKMLTGILQPTAGTAKVLGYVPWRERGQLAYKMGAVFGQRSQLWYHLPPADTFELVAQIYNLEGKTYRQRRDLLVERFGLAPFLNTQVRKLSLGQRMRAEIAASLLHKPEVLFLDEPTIGLDVVARQELRELLREWNRQEGLTVLLTSHDTGDIESVARRVVVINHGRLILDDNVSTMRRRYFGCKVLGVKFSERPKAIMLNGVTVLKNTGYALKLEVNSKVMPIEKVIDEVMKAAPVVDITIEDPPLEEIIAHIYENGASGDAMVQNHGSADAPGLRPVASCLRIDQSGDAMASPLHSQKRAGEAFRGCI